MHIYKTIQLQLSIVIIFIIDAFAFVVSLLNILILFFLQTKLCSKKFQHLHRCLCLVCCLCACKFVNNVDEEDYEPVYHEWDEDSQEVRQQANNLQRQEMWLLLKRQKKRQYQPTESWVQQWKNDLDQQEDQLKQWKYYIKQQEHYLPNKCDLDQWKEELEEWKNSLQEWENDLNATSDLIMQGQLQNCSSNKDRLS